MSEEFQKKTLCSNTALNFKNQEIMNLKNENSVLFEKLKTKTKLNSLSIPKSLNHHEKQLLLTKYDFEYKNEKSRHSEEVYHLQKQLEYSKRQAYDAQLQLESLCMTNESLTKENTLLTQKVATLEIQNKNAVQEVLQLVSDSKSIKYKISKLQVPENTEPQQQKPQNCDHSHFNKVIHSKTRYISSLLTKLDTLEIELSKQSSIIPNKQLEQQIEVLTTEKLNQIEYIKKCELLIYNLLQ